MSLSIQVNGIFGQRKVQRPCLFIPYRSVKERSLGTDSPGFGFILPQLTSQIKRMPFLWRPKLDQLWQKNQELKHSTNGI